MSYFRTVIQRLRRLVDGERQSTVRYMFPVVMGLGVVMAANAITATESSYIRLQASQSTVEAGSRFVIDVYAYAHQPVNAVDITLKFDAAAAEVLSVDKGGSVLTIWTEDPIISKNNVILRGGTYRRGFLGEHKVASIDLKAKQTGKSTFSADKVLLLAGDGAGSAVRVSETLDSKISLYIYDENTDPADIGVSVRINILTDLDGDGRVTLRDISAFMAAWANKDQLYDFNGDNRMTFRDFSIILANYFFQ